jgi:hypothetical protein
MSYLLIGFWYDLASANAAAIKALVVNRVGDFGFSLGIFLTYHLTVSTPRWVFAAAPGCWLQLGRADARLPAPLHGRDGQVGAVSVAHLASRCEDSPARVSSLIHAAKW